MPTKTWAFSLYLVIRTINNRLSMINQHDWKQVSSRHSTTFWEWNRRLPEYYKITREISLLLRKSISSQLFLPIHNSFPLNTMLVEEVSSETQPKIKPWTPSTVRKMTKTRKPYLECKIAEQVSQPHRLVEDLSWKSIISLLMKMVGKSLSRGLDAVLWA